MGTGRAGKITRRDIAKADSLPALIKQLVKRIADGNAEVKEHSAAALASIAQQHHGEHTDVLYTSGAVKPLVLLLEHGSADAQANASMALAAVAQGKPAHQAAIVNAGGVAPLAALLKNGGAHVQEQAAAVLAAIDSDVTHQQSIIAAGCVPCLVAMLKGASDTSKAYAAQAIANAAAYAEDEQISIAKAGAVPLLLGLLATGKGQRPAAAALSKLAAGNATVQAEIAEAGGIAPLLALLNGRSTDAQVQAAAALSEMARGNATTQSEIAKAGGIGPLLALVMSRNPQAQSQGMGALAQLATNNKDNQDAIERMGGISPLVQLLGGGSSPSVQAHAALALAEISRGNPTNQQHVVDMAGVVHLAQLIKSTKDASVKREVACALWALSEEATIKESVAQAGSIPPLASMLGSDDMQSRENAANALSSLGFNSEDNQQQIAQILIEMLSKGTEEVQDRAVRTLNELVRRNPGSQEVIAKAGDPGMLVELLTTGIPNAKDYALWSLSLSIGTQNQQIVLEAGGALSLVEQLQDPRGFIQSQAAAALAKLANSEEARASIQKVGGVRPLISLLEANVSAMGIAEQGDGSSAQQHAAAALADLSVDSATRDEIVAAGGIEPLVKLLTAKNRDAKKFASTALARLSNDHAATQSVIADAGAIAPLVALLDGNEGSEAQQEAAGAIFSLADHENNRQAITETGGIGFLVTLLGCDNPRARKYAEGALVKLSIEHTNRVLIIKKLVDMLQDSGDAAQEQAAAALANLARESEDNRKSIVEANGIPPLLALLDSSSSKTKENAVSAITQLCRKSKENQGLIARAGGIPKLVKVLLGFSSNTMKDSSLVELCTLAASAIKEMAKGNRKNQDSIADAGAITPLVSMLGAPAALMQANAAGAVGNLARGHAENQIAIAKTGAIAPLCTLVREGSPETKDQSASALWSLSTDNAPNKDTIAKLGGIDPLIGLLVSGLTDRSQETVTGALASLALKHQENRSLIAKRLVALLTSQQMRLHTRTAARVLSTLASFCSDAAANQVAITKANGIQPLLGWLASTSEEVQKLASFALACLAADNSTTQIAIARSDGIPPVIKLISKGVPDAKEHAVRTLWHLASSTETQIMIAEAGAIHPLVSILSTTVDGQRAPEFASVIMSRLARTSEKVSEAIAEKGAVLPLVKLVSNGAPGAQHQAAGALAELALVVRHRDMIANAGGIEPLIALLASTTSGASETAARAISHVARVDGDIDDATKSNCREVSSGTDIRGAPERRSKILQLGGIKKLVAMLQGTLPLTNVLSKTVTQEAAAAALAEIAFGNHDMQDAIIEHGGIPPLLAFIRSGSQLGQEHAARAIWYLAASIDNQQRIVEKGTIPELVQLIKTGSLQAQEVAAAGLSDLARGSVAKRQASLTGHAVEQPSLADGLVVAVRSPFSSGDQEGASVPNHGAEEEEGMKEEEQNKVSDPLDPLVAINEAGGIVPLVSLLSSQNIRAREQAAGALWHLAMDSANQVVIAKANGIAPLVNLLDDGTDTAQTFVKEALTRLARNNADNQAQIAKYLVGLLGNQSAGAQQRAARALCELAAGNPGSPVVIVNAGAISPLVTLLSSGTAEVKEEAAGALSTLSLNSPSNQLAIATGLVALLGVGSAMSQEHVTQLLLKLADDPDNRRAIAKSGSIPRLVLQLKGGGHTSVKAQELAAAALRKLSGDSEENVSAIAAAGGLKPIVALLASPSPAAQAQAAAVLSYMTRTSVRNKHAVVADGGIFPLIVLLNKENARAKAEAASALLSLCSGHPDIQRAVAEIGAIKALVGILREHDANAQVQSACALGAIVSGLTEHQDMVAKCKGIEPLVELLDMGSPSEVQGKAAYALAKLAKDHPNNQERVAQANGIELLVALLQIEGAETVKEDASSALWALSANNQANQERVAEAGGIGPLVQVLGEGSVRAQEQAAGALASLAFNNPKNESSIAQMLVTLLGHKDKHTSARAARAISRLARAHASNQLAIAQVGGVKLLVSLLNPKEGCAFQSEADGKLQSPVAEREALESAKVQKEIASALWSMALNNLENQRAIAQEERGVSALIALLGGMAAAGLPREAAGALWSLAASDDNRVLIAECGGIIPLVKLLQTGPAGAQETAAGALHSLAEAPHNRVTIASAGGIPLLVALFESGSDEAKKEAAGALIALAVQNVANQQVIAQSLVELLESGSAQAKEHATASIRDLAQDQSTGAIARAGAIPLLVKQLMEGSERVQAMAASALSQIAQRSADHRGQVTQELVGLLSSADPAVRQRASEALREMAADGEAAPTKQKKAAVKSVSTGGGAHLVSLLKDGLKDGRIEAQEYALLSLSSITDSQTKAAIVEAGCIKLLIASLTGGKLSANAKEHAACVLSRIAETSSHACDVVAAGGINPLVQLLLQGNTKAKVHAANALACLARSSPSTQLTIAHAGAISAFVTWLTDTQLGPAEVAARALSEIARNNPDTQTQIAEEGAIFPLVTMLDKKRPSHMHDMAAGTLATLAKESVVNQIMIAEEEGILPLVELLKGKNTSHENVTRALWHLATLEDNQSAIAHAGAISPLVVLLGSHNLMTQQYAAAALASLVHGNSENQLALAKAGSIEPLINLLGSESSETQEHAVNTLLYLASLSGSATCNNVVKRLVAVLDMRNAAAQMKAAEALAVLASRSGENRKVITAANAVQPLVRLLGDGRRVRAGTPQERAAAVLSDLARAGENKLSIVQEGAVAPLVEMLSSDSQEASKHAAGALWQLAALNDNKQAIVKAGGIPSLVTLLSSTSVDAQRFAAGALWHLASSADNKIAFVQAGAILPLVKLLASKHPEARDNAAAVLSALARTQGNNKKAIVHANGIPPLIQLLSDTSRHSRKHAACALWGLADTMDHAAAISKAGAISPLITLLMENNNDTRGFAAATLSCLCKDPRAREEMTQAGGIEPLLALSQGPATWLRTQAVDILTSLGVTVPDDPDGYALELPEPRREDAMDSMGGATSLSARPKLSSRGSPSSPSYSARSKNGTSARTGGSAKSMPCEDLNRGILYPFFPQLPAQQAHTVSIVSTETC